MAICGSQWLAILRWLTRDRTMDDAIGHMADIVVRCDKCLNEAVQYIHIVMYEGKPLFAMVDRNQVDRRIQYLAWNRGYDEKKMSIEQCKLL